VKNSETTHSEALHRMSANHFLIIVSQRVRLTQMTRSSEIEIHLSAFFTFARAFCDVPNSSVLPMVLLQCSIRLEDSAREFEDNKKKATSWQLAIGRAEEVVTWLLLMQHMKEGRQQSLKRHFREILNGRENSR
jgi:hypothetical protein